MFRTWRERRQCLHGEPGGRSYVKGQLIDLGRRKMFTCERCGKRWFA
jgi:hypothetical protein